MTLKQNNVRLPALFTAVLSLFFYLLTLEPDLTWANFGGDGGELITAAMTLGIPHPPGYPTYVLIGNLFGHLPLGTIAFRFNLLSAISTAVAAGLITATTHYLLSPRPSAPKGLGILRFCVKKSIISISAGLTFAFAPLVWGQAIIAEVYPLNLAFIAAFLYVLISSTSTVGATLVVAQGLDADEPQGDHKGRPYISGLLLGLAVTSHLTSFCLLPLALLLMPRRQWIKLAGGILLGLLPFLALPILAQSNSPVIWGQPDNLSRWWWLVSAQLYRPNVFGLPLADWPARFGEWAVPFLGQFAFVGLFLIPIDIVVRIFVGRFGKSSRDLPNRATAFPTSIKVILGIIGTAVLYIFYAFTYGTNDAAVLLLPALLLLSVVLGFGLERLRWAAIILPLTLVWLNLGWMGSGSYVNVNMITDQTMPGFRGNETAEQTTLRPAAEALLEALPAGAIVETPGDPTIAALWYFHSVEGKRPDIIIFDGNLFQFDWYRDQLGQQYGELEHLAQDDLDGFRAINGRTRPYCQASLLYPGYLNCQ